MIANLPTRAVLVATVLAPVATTAPHTRTVEIAITLPNGGVARAAAPEDEGVMVKLSDGSRLGFLLALSPIDEPSVMVSIWDVDAKPMKRLWHRDSRDWWR